MTVTLEGSNDPRATVEGFKDFSLIYEGTSGLDSDPERGNGGAQIVFPNTTAYKTYRLLITKTRATAGATQYGELILFGKPAHYDAAARDPADYVNPFIGAGSMEGIYMNAAMAKTSRGRTHLRGWCS